MKMYINIKKSNLQTLRLFFFLAIFIIGISITKTNGQGTITTSFTNNNGNALVTFNFQNTNATDVIITEIGGVSGTSGLTTANVYYKTSAINGTPGTIDVANGWNSFGTGSYTAVANTTTTTAQMFLTGLSLVIPAGATYGIAVSTPSIRYSTLAAGLFTLPGGGCNIITGTNIGYGGTLPPAAPINYPRGFIGYVTFIGATPCTGTPVAGTVNAPTSICLGNNFNLSLTGNTMASGITFQWQSSTDNITFSNIAGATGSSYSGTQTVSTYYQCIVTCTASGLSSTSNSAQITMNLPSSCYCASNATSTADEEIFNVTVGTLNNTSTCSTVAGPGSLLNEYSNFTALPSPNLSQSTTVSFSVQVNTCGATNYNSGLAIFIDYNQNGIYTDPGEKVYSNGALADITCVPSTIVSGTFVIPITATLGNTGMRVIDAEGVSGDAITPCLTYGYGETEDYKVNITLVPTCLQPTALTATNILDVSADLGWTIANGETAWDIQYGPAGFTLGTGTILNNVSSNPYSLTGLTTVTNYQYYVLAQCSPTDSSFWSGPYSFTTQLTLCSGTPVPGTISSSTNPICPSINFSLYNTGYSVAGGIIFQWQNSSDGITFTNIPGATNDTLTINQLDTAFYQCIVTCIGSGLIDTTSVFTENMNSFVNCYCTSNATSTADEEILNVTLSTLNNSSTCTTTGGVGSILNEYSNYTGIAPPLLGQLTTVPFSVQIGTCGGNYSNGIGIWIDFNQNGLFTDSGEQVYFSPTAAVGPHTETGTITIPLTATLGLTAMRVVNVETGTPSTILPCGTYTWGETEDYVVNIVPPPTCIQPTSLTATNVLDVSADLGWTIANGETSWDIQYGPSGFTLGTGTILNNVSSNPYTLTGLTTVTNYQYYVLAQCSPTDSSFWSGPYSFTTLLTLCTGTPVPGTISSSANPICPSVNFSLYNTGYSVAGGINFQWQNSSDGITFTNIPSATNDTLTINQLDTTYYQCIVTCIGSGLSDTTAIFTENINTLINCYCTSNATSTADEEIFNVTVGALNNTSTCSTVAGPGSILNEYSNFSAVPAPLLSQTTTVSFSVQVNTCGATNYNSGLAIFIDYNQNGLLTDPGEKVYTNGATANITCVPSTVVTGSFVVPATATLGITRMRVIDAEGNPGDAITPCLVYGYGETEDYLVNISVIPTCPQPLALNATGITQTGATLGWTAGGSETTWNIEGGPFGFTLGTGNLVTGVTNPFTINSLNPSSTYSFYVQADCGAGDLSAWSGPFSFTTLCGLITAPYSENFDAVTTPNLPACWSKIVVGVGTPSVVTSTTAPSTLPNCAQLYNSTASGSSTHILLITPQFSDLPTHTTQIRFKAKFTGTGSPLLHVGTMTNPANQATFTTFQSVFTLTTAWQEFVVPFTTYTGSNQYIAFKHGYGSTLQYIYIDDVFYESTITNTNSISMFESVAIYPNPSAGNFVVEINSENNSDFSLELVSTDGRKVNTKTYSNVNQIKVVYDETNLAKGLYYLIINGDGKQQFKKIVIY